MKNVRRLAIAAVLALGIGTAVYVAEPFNAKPAFADVLQKVQKVQSVRFKTHMKMVMPGQTAPTDADVSSLIVGNRMRQDIRGAMIQIMDFQSGQVLMLMPKQKQAIRMSLDNVPKEVKERNILGHFRNMTADAGKPVGRKEINGRNMDAYAVHDNGQNMTVYADRETKLPVRIESSLDLPQIAPKVEVVMTDFEWDVAADESAVNLDIPPDYKLQKISYDASKPTEKDLLESFRIMTKFGGGKFPDTFDLNGWAASLKNLKAGIPDNDDAKKQEAKQEALSTAIAASRGMMFAQPANGSDFHYAGKGASLNDASRPVFWYRPTSSETYHVIYADLTTQTDVPPTGLPTLESQPVNSLGLFAKPPATDPLK